MIFTELQGNGNYFYVSEKSVNFQIVATSNNYYLLFLGLVVFLATLRFIHLLRYIRSIAVLSAVLAQSAADLLQTLLAFSIIFMGFVGWAYLVFCTIFTSYSSATQSMMALVLMFMGDFDFATLDAQGGAMGKLFFCVYNVIMLYLVLNLFIAILNEYITDIGSNKEALSNEPEVIDYLLDYFKGIISGIPKTDEKKSTTGPSQSGWKSNVLLCLASP